MRQIQPAPSALPFGLADLSRPFVRLKIHLHDIRPALGPGVAILPALARHECQTNSYNDCTDTKVLLATSHPSHSTSELSFFIPRAFNNGL